MPEIVIEKVRPRAGNEPSLIEQVNQLIEEIRLTASRSFRGSPSAAVFDDWLETRCNQFWAHQFELVEDDIRFRVRMAVPNCDVDELRAIVNGQGIDVRSADSTADEDVFEAPEPSKLIRRVELSSPIDATTVTALASQGELMLSGAKAVLKFRKRALAVGG